MQQLSTRLVGDFLGVYGLCGRVSSHHILSVCEEEQAALLDVAGEYALRLMPLAAPSSLGKLTFFRVGVTAAGHSHASSFMNCFLRLARLARTEARHYRLPVLLEYSAPHNTPRAFSTQAGIDDDKMGKEKEGKANFQLKVPKGTKDWAGEDMVIRDKIFGSITEVFKRHGAVTIDT